MALYIGFFRNNEYYTRYATEKVLSGEWAASPEQGNPDTRLAERIRGFPAFLESRGVRLLGSYTPVGQGLPSGNPASQPGVQIIETDNEEDLGAITQYYAGYLHFTFHRYNSVART